MRISIVTPSFNQAGFLEQSIRSVLDQAYPDLEYIIMDGGSTDGSREIIRDHEERLAHWESGRGEGQADAVFRGFRRSTGDVLGWVNSDDILLAGFRRHPGSKSSTLLAVKISENAMLRTRHGLSRYPPTWRVFLRAWYRIGFVMTERMGWLRHSLGLVEPPIRTTLWPDSGASARPRGLT